MKFISSIRLTLFTAIAALSFTACTNEPPAENTAAENGEPNTKAASAKGSMQELASRSCECYKELNTLRHQAKAEFEAGDTLAYERVDFDLIEARKNAKACVKDIIESIKSNPPVKKEFEDALVAACPQYATSILLMNKVNWKAIE